MNNSNTAIVHSQEKRNLLVQLRKAQATFGYIPEEVMVKIAATSETCIGEVYGIATFYSFLSRKPQGKNVIKICRSLPCYLKHSEMIVKSIAEVLGIKPGQTTPDEKFSFELTNCIGACDQAPAMLVNGRVYGNLTPDKINEILKKLDQRK